MLHLHGCQVEWMGINCIIAAKTEEIEFPGSKLASLSRIINPCTGRKSWSVDGSSSGIDQYFFIHLQHLSILKFISSILDGSSTGIKRLVIGVEK